MRTTTTPVAEHSHGTRGRSCPHLLADPADVTFGRGPTFFTAQGNRGASTAGISEDGATIRAIGYRAGTGEFEGLLIHDVMYLTADTAANEHRVPRLLTFPGFVVGLVRF